MSMRYPGGFIASTPVTAAYPSGVWTQAQAIPYQAQNVWTRDQYWPYTTLLLQGNGTNGAQNNTFLDSSSNNFTITRNGNTTQGSFTPYEQDGYWSNYFGGSGNYFSIANNNLLALGTGDFTFETWVFVPSGALGPDNQVSLICAGAQDTGSGGGGWNIHIFGGTNTTVRLEKCLTNGTAVAFSWTAFSGADVPRNVWIHLAVVRTSSTTTAYWNGVSLGNTSLFNGVDMPVPNNRAILIASGANGVNQNFWPFTGYLSNLRVVKGTAVYTTNFTPPVAPLTAITNTSLLACQGNRFRDASANNISISVVGSPSVQAFQPFPGATTYSGTVLGGSGYFDGSGDYLTAPGGSAPTGSGAWTVEFWYYFTASQTDSRIFGGGQNTFNLGISSNGALYYGKSNVGNVFGGSPLPPGINFWTHVVIGKNASSTYRIWVNGVSQATGTDSYSYDSGTNFIGASSAASFFFTGYLANLRVTNTDVYGVSNTTITVPTAPLTAISGTQFLMGTTNAGIFDAAVMNDLETVGNAQVSTSVVKYGTGSMAFDGSGDYLRARATPDMSFGTGDFTIEMWLYLNQAGPSGYGLVDNGNNSQANLFFYINGQTPRVFFNNANVVSGPDVPVAVWTHLAVTRIGGVMRVFTNGIPGTAVTNTTSLTNAGPFGVGADYVNGQVLNGYIDDLRITKGVARYLTSFTPPPARMPGQ